MQRSPGYDSNESSSFTTPVKGGRGGNHGGVSKPITISPSPMKQEPIQHQIKRLKDSYDLSILRMNEFNNLYYSNNAVSSPASGRASPTQSNNMYIRVHGQKASKVYSALSSLIYASIAMAKVENLEDFVRQQSVSLPTTMIDLEEWEHILTLAKDCRERLILESLVSHPTSLNNNRKLKQLLSNEVLTQEVRQKQQFLEFLAVNPIRNVRDELVYVRQEMLSELNNYQQDITKSMTMVYYATQKMLEMLNHDVNAQRVASLKQQVKELTQTLEQTQKESEEAYQSQRDSYEKIIEDMGMTHATEMKSMKESYRIEFANVKDTHDKEVAELKAYAEKEITERDTRYAVMVEEKTAVITAQEESITSLSSRLSDAEAKIASLEEANRILTEQLQEMTTKYNDTVEAKEKMDRGYQLQLAHMNAEFSTVQTVERLVFETIIKVHESDIATLATARDGLQARVDGLEAEKVEHLAKIASDAETMNNLNQTIAHLEQVKKELEDDKADLIAKKTDLEEKKLALELEKAHLIVTQTTLEGDKAVLEAEKKGLFNVQAELESQIAILQSEKGELQTTKSTLEGEKSDLLVAKAKLEVSLEELTHSKAQLQVSLDELNQEHKKLVDEFNRLSESHETLGKSHSTIVNTLAEVEKAKNELEDHKVDLDITIDDLKLAKKDLEDKLQQAEEKANKESQNAEEARERMLRAKEESESSKRQAEECKEDSSRFKQGHDKIMFELRGLIEDLRREKQQLLDLKVEQEKVIEGLKDTIKHEEKKLNDAHEEYARLQKDYQVLNTINDGLKVVIVEKDRLTERVHELEKSKKYVEDDKAKLEETIKELRNTQRDLEDKVRAANNRADDEMRNAERYQDMMKLAYAEKDMTLRKSEEVNEDTSRFKKGYDKVVFELQGVITELRERIQADKAELANAQKLLESKQATIDAHQSKMEYLKSTIDMQKVTIAEQKVEIEDYKSGKLGKVRGEMKGDEVTISTEMFDQIEGQLLDMAVKLQEEKLISTKLHLLLQAAEKELKTSQDKLLTTVDHSPRQ